MSFEIVKQNRDVAKRRILKLQQQKRDRIERLKNLGAKSFDAVYVQDGKPKSDVHG